jgi:hypothetical protein
MAHKHSIRPRGLLRTPAQHVCQHEGWFDDISDGPISATVKNSRATRRGDRERGVGNSLRPPGFFVVHGRNHIDIRHRYASYGVDAELPK